MSKEQPTAANTSPWRHEIFPKLNRKLEHRQTRYLRITHKSQSILRGVETMRRV